MGRKIRELVNTSQVQVRLIEMLDSELALSDDSSLAKALSKQGPSLDTSLSVISALKAGIQDSW